LSNEITIQDIAEGLDRAFRHQVNLKGATRGMLVIRAWLTH
jgi:hypothetical protein